MYNENLFLQFEIIYDSTQFITVIEKLRFYYSQPHLTCGNIIQFYRNIQCNVYKMCPT